MLSTAGFTCVTFVAGALAWWAPTFLQLGFALHPNGHNVDPDEYVFILSFICLILAIVSANYGFCLFKPFQCIL